MIPFFFQMCKNASSEEDFALTDAIKIGIELQGLDLKRQYQNQIASPW
jgi:hypothetical protein